MSRPAMSIRRIACGIAKPSYTGTECVTPSPESMTTPVVRPEAYLPLTASTGTATVITQLEWK